MEAKNIFFGFSTHEFLTLKIALCSKVVPNLMVIFEFVH